MYHVRLLFAVLIMFGFLIPSSVTPLIATAAEKQASDGTKDQKKSGDQSPLQPIRDAVKGLEKGISEEPPKAIRSIKEGFRKRFKTDQDQEKSK